MIEQSFNFVTIKVILTKTVVNSINVTFGRTCHIKINIV